MKKNKIALIGLTFILGAFFGVSLITLLSFVNPATPPSPPAAFTEIKDTEANHLFHNYFDTASPINDKLKGFFVDRFQLEAMDSLAKKKDLAGFRLYIGRTDKGEKLSIIVGITSAFSDATSGKIYRTESRTAGPCPPFCDRYSTITK